MPAKRPPSTAKKRSICPVACALDVIGDKWTLLIIRDLFCGKSRYGEFLRSPERIATNILADRLEKLVAHGLAEPFDAEGHAAYRLTKKGESLLPVANAIAAWGLANIAGTKAMMRPRGA